MLMKESDITKKHKYIEEAETTDREIIVRPFNLFIIGFSRFTWIRRVKYGRGGAKSGITNPQSKGNDKVIKHKFCKEEVK